MGTLEILVGISGSGKSTYGHEQWAKDPDNVTLVNRDKIRELLFGFTESGIKDYYAIDKIGKFEKKVTRYEDTLINEALSHGNRVIVDATHLNRKYIERFKYWNVPTTIKFFPVLFDVATQRISSRNRKIDDSIVQKQFNQYKSLIESLKKEELDFTPVKFENDPNKDRTIIFDIDGTLAHKGDRSPYDWLKVGEDTIDFATCLTADYFAEANGITVTICTGRDGVSLEETEKWLDENSIHYDKIYIREAGDMRPDWIVKEEMWREISKNNHIVGMFDDRLQVVRRARALGLKVFNVEYNNF